MKVKKLVIIFFSVFVVLIAFISINQFLIVTKAHSSFENYYAFRGCTHLIKKTDTYALCKLSSGKVIKIVDVKDKWYLDGDLPVCYFKFCL